MANDTSSNQPFDPAVWDNFCDTLKQTGRQILDNSPDDGLDRTEGYRYLARLTRHALGQFIERRQPLRPKFEYNSPRIGGDNPDYLYGSATVNGRQAYRIRGNRRQAFNLGIGSYYGGLGSGQGLQCSGFLLLSDLEVDAAGNFEILVGAEKQPGNWLPMEPQCNAILVRQTVLDRLHDEPADLTIEPVGDTVADRAAIAPLDAAGFTRSLKTAGLFVSGVVGQFLNWTNAFKASPNTIGPTDPELLKFAQGDPNTRYYNGYYDLAEGQGLEVTLEPPECEYWNIQVTNYWLESLDYLDYQTHYNHHNAAVDDDGKVRVVIAKHNPGVPNWIDTAGHDRGCISLRWIKAQSDSQPICRVIDLPITES